MTNLSRGAVVAVFFAVSGCGMGVASLAEPSPEAVSAVDTGAGLTPVDDAGTPPVVLVEDAGTPPVIAPEVDAGTPPVVEPVDAGRPPVIDPTADLTFIVDTSAQQRPISRFIYGKNFNGSTWQNQPHLTLNRLGGNRWTAYNWENNASNAGSDYNFQNDSFLGGGDVAGEAVRGPVATAQSFGGATIVTVPMAGWVAADKLGTNVTGQAVTTRFREDVAVKPSALTYPPSLTDGAVYQDEFVAWLEQRFPGAHGDPSREIFYSLDNEPDLWSDTHSEMHPVPVTYAELLTKSVDYASTVKRVAPTAKVFGAVSYGYNGYVNLQNAVDANGRDFLEFFLDGMRAAGTSAGTRLLDVLDLHWYPEAKGGGARIVGEGTTAEVVEARVQAPRSLWDASYVETSWIATSMGTAIRLLPSLEEKIATHYAGTRLAFTEYYYGGGAHISGAVAQADVLGIFGREGVFAAALWPMTSDIRFIDAAFRMFRNFDGAGSHFGDTSVRALTSDAAVASVYASVDESSSGRVVLVMVNKASVAKTTSLQVTHAASVTRAEVYQLTSATAAPVRGADVAASSANTFRLSLPPMSVSTVVLRP